MKKEGVILIAEDDEEHFELIEKSLRHGGIRNEMLRFADGQETLDFLFVKGDGPKREHNREYLLLLDIRMPKINGVEVLEKIKQDAELKRIPVIMLTITDDPHTIERCYRLGCSMYMVKPVEYESFVDAVRKIGLFLSVVEMPQIKKAE